MLERSSSALISLVLMTAGSLAAQAAPGGGDGCEGPFVSDKYPQPHLVILDTESRCYVKWTVKPTSPLDVRCVFWSPLEKPTTAPDVALTLSPEAYEAFLLSVSDHGAVNTSAWLGDHYFFSGFRNDLTPADGTPGC